MGNTNTRAGRRITLWMPLGCLLLVGTIAANGASLGAERGGRPSVVTELLCPENDATIAVGTEVLVNGDGSMGVYSITLKFDATAETADATLKRIAENRDYLVHFNRLGEP